MKRVLLAIFLLGFLVPGFLFAASSTERVKSFDSVLTIDENADVSIVETIKYDFGSNQKRGIYRTIPVDYAVSSGTRTTEISDISIADQSGASQIYTQSKTGGNIELKIGDSTKTVSGEKTYVIRYKVKYAINYFADHDELFFNINGTGWQVPVDAITAKVILPKGFTEAELQKVCFRGAYGSKTGCAAVQFVKDTAGLVSGVSFSDANLESGENLTTVVGFPTGIVARFEAPKTNALSISPAVFAFGVAMVILLPILTLGIMLFVWARRGKDPGGKCTVVAQYGAPDGLTPLEIGGIINGNIENREITAEIIYLAEKGYLKITRLAKKVLFVKWDEYEIEKIKEFDEKVSIFDMEFFNGIFGGKKKVTTASIKTDNADDMKELLKNIKKGVFAKLTEAGYYVKSPYEVRKNYLISALLIGICGAILIFTIILSLFGVGLILSSLVIMVFAFIMPAKTKKGAETKELALGLKLYMSVAEKDRLEFHNAPKKDPKKFEELLPYAVAMGVEKEWGKQFEGIYKTQPSWYSDPSGAGFNAVIFTSSLNSFSSSMNQAVVGSTTASGSSGFGGGGFSGGGFGGGGGGSW